LAALKNGALKANLCSEFQPHQEISAYGLADLKNGAVKANLCSEFQPHQEISA